LNKKIAVIGVSLVLAACSNNHGTTGAGTTSYVAPTTTVSAQHSALLDIDMPNAFRFYQNDSGVEVWSYASPITTGAHDPVNDVLALASNKLPARGLKLCPNNGASSWSWSDGNQKITIGNSTGLSTSTTTVSGYLRVSKDNGGPEC
jgi:hypothetical protein